MTADADGDGGGYLDIDERDVVETVLAAEATSPETHDDPPDDDPGQLH